MAVKWAWTREKPTEPGNYWYYGCVMGKEKRVYKFCEVWKNSNGSTLIMGGYFSHDFEPLDGHFVRAQLPEPPPEDSSQGGVGDDGQ